jgi:hypothetical protein
VQGAGATVTRFWKAGNVDYKKVVELQGVDLERYPGKAREEVRVTVVQSDHRGGIPATWTWYPERCPAPPQRTTGQPLAKLTR